MASRKIRTKGAGTVEWRNGHAWVRASLADGTRPRYRLCGERCDCHDLTRAALAKRAQRVSERERERANAEIARHKAVVAAGRTTFKAFGEQWTTGALHRKWPDHVKVKKTAKQDGQRLVLHVYPHIGNLPVADVTLDDCEDVMAHLPAELSSATRRHVAQLMHRILAMAVYPARLRASSPLPRGFMPRVRRTKALTYLYPDEEAKLLKCTDPKVPLLERLYFGFLAREGLRESEALALTWADIDLKRGACRLDSNKTDDPRAWALGDDVVRALRRWHVLRGTPKRGFIFADKKGHRLKDWHLAARLRDALKLAGVDRPELYEKSATRQPVRVHDLRATFVTLALATGRSETWVADRTGHRSSVMINRYRRSARTAAELGQGWLVPLDATIPELAKLANVLTLTGA